MLGRPKSIIPDTIKQQICEQYLAEITLPKIQKEFKLCYNTCKQILNDNNIPILKIRNYKLMVI